MKEAREANIEMVVVFASLKSVAGLQIERVAILLFIFQQSLSWK